MRDFISGITRYLFLFTVFLCMYLENLLHSARGILLLFWRGIRRRRSQCRFLPVTKHPGPVVTSILVNTRPKIRKTPHFLIAFDAVVSGVGGGVFSGCLERGPVIIEPGHWLLEPEPVVLEGCHSLLRQGRG